MESKVKRVLPLVGGHALLIAALACSAAPSESSLDAADARGRVVVSALELPSRPLIEAHAANVPVLGAQLTTQGESELSLQTLSLKMEGKTSAVAMAHLWLDLNGNGLIDVDTDVHISAAPVGTDGACEFDGLDISLDLDLLVAIDVGDDCEPGDEISVSIDLDASVVVDDDGDLCELDGEANGEVTVVADVDVCVDVSVSADIDASVAVAIGDSSGTLAFRLESAADVTLETLALDARGDVAVGLLADLVLDVDGDGRYTADVDVVLKANAALTLDGCRFEDIDLDVRAGVAIDLLVVLKGTEACKEGDVLSLSLDLDSTVLISLDGNGACVDGLAACLVTAIDVGEINGGGSLSISATSQLDLAVSNVLALELDADVDVELNTLSLISIGSVDDTNVTLDLWMDVNGNGKIDVDVDICLAVDVSFDADNGICTFDNLGLFIGADASVSLLVAVDIEGAVAGDTFGLIIGPEQCAATLIGTEIDVNLNVDVDTGLCLVVDVEAGISVEL